jgi:dUTP pyrophosphatase
MKIPIKLLRSNAKIPTRATEGSAAYDLYATTWESPAPGLMLYTTGVSMAIPKGYVGLIVPRSSVYKTGLTLANSVGVIDSDYRGEIKFIYRAREVGQRYGMGDRVGQIIIVKHNTIDFEEVDDLDQTPRGKGGFGSTGN